MIDLHPVPEARHECPRCSVELHSVDWYIPGMRNLARMVCPECETEYYGDMPAGHGTLYPALLEVETGVVHGRTTGKWFAEYLREGYANRSEHEVPFSVDERHPVERPVLVNCLDMNYVHSVNKLLHAQYHVDETDRDVIVMIPPFVDWLVPDGVAQVWTVEQSLAEGRSWNDWLAAEIRDRVAEYDDCQLSVMFPHTHHEDFDIDRFTGVEPFPMDEWEERLDRPTVTFIWRNVPSYGSVSRLWCSLPDSDGLLRRTRGYVNMAAEKVGKTGLAAREQRSNIVESAETLRDIFPGLDVAVAGVGEWGTFPPWIADLRFPSPDADQERQLCERYAESHVVVGTHGSHMGLPSAHAGAVVDIMPGWKRGNMGGDLLLRECGQRDSMLLYRHLPSSVSATEVAREVGHLLVDWPMRKIRMQRRYTTHEMDIERLYEVRELEERYAKIISEVSDNPRVDIGSDTARSAYETVESVTQKIGLGR